MHENSSGSRGSKEKKREMSEVRPHEAWLPRAKKNSLPFILITNEDHHEISVMPEQEVRAISWCSKTQTQI
jgi:hypothetical protein